MWATALAHEIPDSRIDRAMQVTVRPGRLMVQYEVSLAELTAIQDLRRLAGKMPGREREELLQEYGERVALLNARGILVQVGASETSLQTEGFTLTLEEHPRYLFNFACDLPEQGEIRVQDQNYISSEGISRLAVQALEGVSISGYSGPARVEDAEPKPVWMLDEAEEAATHEVTFRFQSAQVNKTPSEASTPRSVLRLPRQNNQESEVNSRSSQKLSRLLGPADGWQGWFTFGLAVLLGLVHALQPGHGKTLVAAASAGSHQHGAGLIVAVVATLTHLSSVILVAAVLWFTGSRNYQAIQSLLTRLAGFVLTVLGVYRVGSALGGLASDQSAELRTSATPTDWKAQILIGVSGGLIPCWDAVLLLLLADLSGKLTWGIVLLLGFSLGMITVLSLTALGAGAVRRGLGQWYDPARMERALKLIAGLVLTALGGYLWAVA